MGAFDLNPAVLFRRNSMHFLYCLNQIPILAEYDCHIVTAAIRISN